MASTQIDLEKITFSVEPLESIQKEIMPLVDSHWEEVEWRKDIKPAPDWDKYQRIESNGGLVIFAARDEDLIGYNVFFIQESLHYQGMKMAVQDLVYIKPDKRGFGSLFIHWCNEKLKELEVAQVFYHLKANNNFGDKILVPQGFTLVDMVYGKVL